MRSVGEAVQLALAEIDSLSSPDNMQYSQAVEFMELVRDGIIERLDAMQCYKNEEDAK